ncbi:MAG TPA: hypothetical protein VIU46_08755 [Gallionellaceae bacterium]
MRFPLVVVYAAIAFNISMFTVLLQADVLILHSPILKAFCWAATVIAWVLTYKFRGKYIKLF